LPDGSRLCAVVEPVALDGPSMTIRRHRPRRIPLEQFTTPPVADALRQLVDGRVNMLVTGATSTGKTTLLTALASGVDPAERLVVIEDTAELALAGHVLRLEARPPGLDGVRGVDPATLVRTALRLRPDRLVLGEFRGLEALAVVEALNTGHDGSLSTCHANSALDGLRRLETLLMQAAPSWPLAAIRRQVSRSIDVVVHLDRTADGRRTIAEVVEVVEGDGEPAGRVLVAGDDVVAACTRRRR
ncbi:MAG: CpaF family protein, partial [Ilumatobacter sp.]|nr:CpaF family protein [Ilumatobacter sp.]